MDNGFIKHKKELKMKILSQEIKIENGIEKEIFEIKVRGGIIFAKARIKEGRVLIGFEGHKCRTSQGNAKRQVKILQELSPLITIK